MSGVHNKGQGLGETNMSGVHNEGLGLAEQANIVAETSFVAKGKGKQKCF